MHIITLAADKPTSLADWIIAWGTLLAAVAAVAGLGVTIVFAKRDRTEAEKQLKEERTRHRGDLERTKQQLADERRRADAVQLKQYHLTVLADVAEQYSRYTGYANMPQASVAAQRLVVLLRMMPDGTATLLKHQFSVPRSPLDDSRLGEIGQQHSGVIDQPPPTGWVHEELGKNAEEIVNRPTLPAQPQS